MANNRVYKVAHRRRREQKTDYKRRLALLKSGTVRLAIRKTTNRTIVQAIEYNTKGDIVLASVSSNELKGWKGNSSNVKAAYLAGYALGKKASEKKVKDMVLDIGLQRSTSGGRIYAALKGVVDAGIIVPHSAKMLPADERISGDDVEAVKKAI